MNERALALKNATVPLVLSSALAVLLLGAAGGRLGKKEILDRPPIIVLSETQGFSFPVGSAKLPEQFSEALNSMIVPRIKAISTEYDCDVIEVVGHTDGQRVQAISNLDSKLMSAIGEGLADLTPGSNADLGLMRAWAVARVLLSREELKGMRIAAYSAGQMIRTDGSYASPGNYTDEPERRRIEIRVRRAPR